MQGSHPFTAPFSRRDPTRKKKNQHPHNDIKKKRNGKKPQPLIIFVYLASFHYFSLTLFSLAHFPAVSCRPTNERMELRSCDCSGSSCRRGRIAAGRNRLAFFSFFFFFLLPLLFLFPFHFFLLFAVFSSSTHTHTHAVRCFFFSSLTCPGRWPTSSGGPRAARKSRSASAPWTGRSCRACTCPARTACICMHACNRQTKKGKKRKRFVVVSS